jgi:hypothetical protein
MIRFKPYYRQVSGESEEERARRVTDEQAAKRYYNALAKKAKGASRIKLVEAMLALDRLLYDSRRVHDPLVPYKDIAAAARKVVRESDKLAAWAEMPAVERRNIKAGHATRVRTPRATVRSFKP